MKLFDLFEDMGPIIPPDRKIQSATEFDATISEFARRYEAARRALGLVNKLSDGPTKKKHASRVLSQMNVIRSYLNTLIRQLESMSQ